MSEDSEWDYAVDDVGPTDDDTDDTPTPADPDAEETEEKSASNIGGTLGVTDSLEPGTPTAENTFFVLLGATMTILLFLVVTGVI